MGRVPMAVKEAAKVAKDAKSEDNTAEAEQGLEAAEVEVGDIEAYARSQLRPGEAIAGDEGTEEASRGVCIKPAILQKLQDITYQVPEGAKRVPWVDSMTIDGQQEVPKGIGPKDGVKLESAFVRMAGDAVKEAYRRLKVMKIPCSRPSDFYAEMLRSDQMMFRVRERASEEQRRIKIVEDRKKSQMAKKFAKKARSKKLEARAEEKRQSLQEIKTWQKKTKRDGNNVDDQDLDNILDRQNRRGKGEGKGEQGKGKKGKPAKSKKREAFDKKFGYGGKKKRARENDVKSTDDFRDSPWARKGKAKGKGKGKKGMGGGGGKGPSSKGPSGKRRKK